MAATTIVETLIAIAPTAIGRSRPHEGHVANAQLLVGDRQEVEDPGAGRIGKGREEFGDRLCTIGIQAPAEERADGVGVEAVDVAPIGVNRRGE